MAIFPSDLTGWAFLLGIVLLIFGPINYWTGIAIGIYFGIVLANIYNESKP